MGGSLGSKNRVIQHIGCMDQLIEVNRNML